MNSLERSCQLPRCLLVALPSNTWSVVVSEMFHSFQLSTDDVVSGLPFGVC